jgi:hypothetical protein
LNSHLIVVLLAAIVLSTTYAAATSISAPLSKIYSVGSVDPYVEVGVPFEIAFDGCVAVPVPQKYEYYIEHTAGYVPWPGGQKPSKILYNSSGTIDTGEPPSHYDPCHYVSGKVTVTLYEIGHVGLCLHLGGDNQDFDVNVLKSLPDVKISDVQYVKAPDSIARDETTPVVMKVKYDLPEDMALHFEIKDQDTGSVVGSWDAPHKLSGEGVFTSSPIDITHPVSRAGDWNLRVKVSAESALSPGLTAKDSKDIIILVESETLPTCNVSITKVDHVKSPDTVAVGEKTPVTVTAEYHDLLPRSRLLLTFKDVDTGEEITSPLESEALPASGTYVFPPVNLKATNAGDWHLQAVVKVNANCISVATKRFTITVVEPEGIAKAQIADAQYVEPPDTIAVGEETPVVFDVNYQNLVPGSKLKMYIIDKATNQNLATKSSIVLSGSGTYTFPPMAIKPDNRGDWKLRAEVRLEGNTLNWMEFTIKVVHS